MPCTVRSAGPSNWCSNPLPDQMEQIVEARGALASAASEVCAVVVTFCTGKLIRRCVESISEQVGWVVIVDNGSEEETVGELKELESQHHVLVIYNHKNLGIGVALNQGVRAALKRGYRWILTLDDDSQATPGMVEKLLEAYRGANANARLMAANPFDRNSGSFWIKPEAGKSDGNLVEIQTAFSSGSLIDTRVFSNVGFFNEALFLYFVDSDFCLRLRRAGFRMYARCDAVLLHTEGCKKKRRFLWRYVIHDGYGADARYYIARNSIFMLRNYYRDEPSICRQMVKQKLLLDLVKITLYDRNKFCSIRSTFQGLFDGLTGRYGARGSLR